MSYNGCCFFAYNNSEIDYVKLALLAALYVKKHMKNNNTCLITTQGDYAYLESTQGEELVDRAFNEVIITNDKQPENVRTHFDSPWSQFSSHFQNNNKHMVNKYSPFDKTLLLDIDYIVRNDNLDYLFEQDDIHVGMYDTAQDLRCDPPHIYEQYLNPVGIPMLWSTVVYFDRSDTSDMFFDIWAHCQQEYSFYKFLYNMPGNMYRTDFCVSIANHIMNGMASGNMLHTIIDGPMQYMDQKDDIVEIKTADDWIFLANDREQNWVNILARNYKQNLHVMNKRAMDRHFDQMIKVVT